MNALVVGSSLIDLFISLQKNEDLKIKDNAISFTLGDKIPIDIQTLTLGGNGVNVTSALQKLQINTSFYTYLGTDVLSNHIKTLLQKEDITLHIEGEETITGSLSIILNLNYDRIIFSHHNEFTHSFDSSKIDVRPDVIFLTSIGKDWTDAYSKVLSYAKDNSIPIAFSPGSQQMSDMNEVFIKTVHQSKMLFCNMQEAQEINKALTGNAIDNARELLLNIKNNGFDLLSITDGKNGAYAVGSGEVVYKIESTEPDGKEKTGAGDSYAGGFLAGYMHKKPIETCMKWGVLNAVGEMRQIGSRTGQLTLSEMEEKVEKTTFQIQTL